jgi:hypothetical protein
MAEASLLNIEELFFPILELRTLTTHDARGDRTGTMLQFGRRVTKLDNQPGKYGFGMSIATDDTNSKNPPYKFVVEAYAIVSITGTPLEGEAAEKFIELHGAPLMMGAMRERLAELTARAPWGRFLVKPIPLQDPQQINLI